MWEVKLHDLKTREWKTIYIDQTKKPTRQKIISHAGGKQDWYIDSIEKIENK